MAWVTLLGHDIHYTDTGEGQPVVMIHGMGSCAACWEGHIGRLAGRFRVLAYDSVNHGFSAGTPRDAPEPDRVDELEAFLDAVQVERPILVGQSMGSLTSLRWLIRHPDRARGVVAAGMGWPLEGGRGKVLDDEERIWIGVGDSFTEPWKAAHPAEFDRYIRVRSTATRIEAERHPRTATVRDPGWGRDDPQVKSGLQAVSTPLVLFIGSRDRMLEGARTVHSLVPGSRLVVADGMAHNAYYERMDEFITLIDSVAEQTA
jgi:pimeloyl-ACP methyl ester carboxylesterase